MFLRFAVGELDSESNSWKGLFAAAYELRDSGNLSISEIAQVQELIDWFKTYLPVPTCYHKPESRKAICWFVPDAGEPLTKTWRLASFLEKKNVDVRLYKTRDPGRRLYTDPYQVVAVLQTRSCVRRAR